ncbi:MAG: hypothetical protein AABO57_22430 [Acidobacteriota bacterium]
MYSDARRRLAAAQLELVRALVSNEIAPAEFDNSRIQATADALLLKRAHAVAGAWPSLARSLGSAFDDRFALYSRSRPVVQEGGPLADGRAFARELARAGAVQDDVALETLAFDLRHRVSSDRVIARRGFSFGASLLKQPLRCIIGIRIPLLRERWISIPLTIFFETPRAR